MPYVGPARPGGSQHIALSLPAPLPFLIGGSSIHPGMTGGAIVRYDDPADRPAARPGSTTVGRRSPQSPRLTRLEYRCLWRWPSPSSDPTMADPTPTAAACRIIILDGAARAGSSFPAMPPELSPVAMMAPSPVATRQSSHLPSARSQMSLSDRSGALGASFDAERAM